MLVARVLRVGLDSLELCLGADPFDLELGDENGHLPGGVADEGDRPLGRQEAEAREVLDVVLVEEHVAGQRLATDVLEERLASRRQLCRWDPGCLHGGKRLTFVRSRDG